MPQILVDRLRKTYRIHERDPGVLGALRALVRPRHRTVDALAERVIVIGHGRVLADCAVEALRAQVAAACRLDEGLPPPIDVKYALNARKFASSARGCSGPSSRLSAPSSAVRSRASSCRMRDIASLPTNRRTAETAALRFLLSESMKGNDTPVIVLGDINDGQHSNTANILTDQPRYLVGDSEGGGDVALYTAQTLQEYRDTRDVYYTHIHQDIRESLDHILEPGVLRQQPQAGLAVRRPMPHPCNDFLRNRRIPVSQRSMSLPLRRTYSSTSGWGST